MPARARNRIRKDKTTSYVNVFKFIHFDLATRWTHISTLAHRHVHLPLRLYNMLRVRAGSNAKPKEALARLWHSLRDLPNHALCSTVYLCNKAPQPSCALRRLSGERGVTLSDSQPVPSPTRVISPRLRLLVQELEVTSSASLCWNLP